MIRVRGLTKQYDDHLALDTVDLTVPAGSVYGLVGPNGAGKTTLLSILAGLRSASGGDVAIDAPPQRRAVLPDAPRFDKWLTAREVIELSSHLCGHAGTDAVDTLLATAGLADAADRAVGGFSRGMLQRLGLATTLVGEPDVVLLDEPAAALDPAGRREVLNLVNQMRGAATIIFSSHILSDVQAVSDRVGILHEGRLRFEGPVAELLEQVAETAYVVRLRSPVDDVIARLQAEPWVESVEPHSPGALRIAVTSFTEAERNLIPVLAAAGARVVSVEPQSVTLERAFLEITT